ncbi:MAG: hypothetical protein MUF18_14475 [Fimbriiglobus sp.]|nr:hypothetical protein [Fimbriiglobus sp.]
MSIARRSRCLPRWTTRSSGGTSTGKYIIVVYELVLDDPRTLYPITAYQVPPP